MYIKYKYIMFTQRLLECTYHDSYYIWKEKNIFFGIANWLPNFKNILSFLNHQEAIRSVLQFVEK